MTTKASLWVLQESPADEKRTAIEPADDFAQRAQRGDMSSALAFLSRKDGQQPQEPDVLPS
jgi:hypothetical protein